MTLWREIFRASLVAGLSANLAAPVSAAPGFGLAGSFTPAGPRLAGRAGRSAQAERVGERRRGGAGSFRHGRREIGGVIVPIVPDGSQSVEDAYGGAPPNAERPEAAPASFDERWRDDEVFARSCVRPLIIDLAAPDRAGAPLPRVIYGSRPPPCRSRS